MNEISEAQQVPNGDGDNRGTEGERNVVVIAYILHALGVLTAGIITIAAVIVGHLKVNDTDSDFIRSHHRWLLRTFWWGLLWYLICGVLVLVFVGFIGYVILAVWWIYRIVRGLLAFAEGRAMPLPD